MLKETESKTGIWPADFGMALVCSVSLGDTFVSSLRAIVTGFEASFTRAKAERSHTFVVAKVSRASTIASLRGAWATVGRRDAAILSIGLDCTSGFPSSRAIDASLDSI